MKSKTKKAGYTTTAATKGQTDFSIQELPSIIIPTKLPYPGDLSVGGPDGSKGGTLVDLNGTRSIYSGDSVGLSTDSYDGVKPIEIGSEEDRLTANSSNAVKPINVDESTNSPSSGSTTDCHNCVYCPRT